MRIAQIAPLTEAIPPKLYGGTERVVSWLTEELVELGHDVTLFASGNSVTRRSSKRCGRARCVSTARCATRSRCTWRCSSACASRAEEFDMLHFHLDYYPFSLFSRQSHAVRDDVARPARSARTPAGVRHVPRCAGDLDLRHAARARCRRRTGSRPSITACRATCWRRGRCKPSYLAFLGRICAGEAVDRAIRIAVRGGHAAEDRRQGRPRRSRLLRATRSSRCSTSRASSSSARSTTREKSAFLSGAIALLMPIDWPEPFGLVMIEAMACGTPVIAFSSGSVPEVIERRRHRLHRRERGRGRRRHRNRLAQLSRRASAPASRNASPRAAWPRTIWTSIAA